MMSFVRDDFGGDGAPLSLTCFAIDRHDDELIKLVGLGDVEHSFAAFATALGCFVALIAGFVGGFVAALVACFIAGGRRGAGVFVVCAFVIGGCVSRQFGRRIGF